MPPHRRSHDRRIFTPPNPSSSSLDPKNLTYAFTTSSPEFSQNAPTATTKPSNTPASASGSNSPSSGSSSSSSSKKRNIPVPCGLPGCNKVSNRIYDLLRHMTTGVHREYLLSPGVDAKALLAATSLQEHHVTNALKMLEAVYKCDVCPAAFDRDDTLKRHFNLRHRPALLEQVAQSFPASPLPPAPNTNQPQRPQDLPPNATPPAFDSAPQPPSCQPQHSRIQGLQPRQVAGAFTYDPPLLQDIYRDSRSHWQPEVPALPLAFGHAYPYRYPLLRDPQRDTAHVIDYGYDLDAAILAQSWDPRPWDSLLGVQYPHCQQPWPASSDSGAQ